LRLLDQEAGVQEEAVRAARQSVVITANQYRAGTVGYLNLLIAQSTELTSERVAIDIRGRRMIAAVLLIKALGGGWEVSQDARYGRDFNQTRKASGW
jgi:Outer membrane protein